MRFKGRRDDNHDTIRKAFQDMGCTVWDTADLGCGAPDMVVGVTGLVNELVEVKDGSKPPSRRQLTPDEQEFHRDWRGRAPVIVESEQDAIDLVNRCRRS